ncbi:MAG: hypothetical protein RBU37_22205 [Myxococcota bacterium]|jgi:hypothetical protein|nr:hypothetical protein [Myxococcota bacterium]
MRRHRIISTLFACAVLFAPAALFAQSAQEVLSKYDKEPTVTEVQAVAMAYAGLEPERIDGWYSSAAVANIVPKRLEYRFRFRDEDKELDRLDDDLNNLGAVLGGDRRRDVNNNQQMEHNVRVEWDLSELVFNPDTLRTAREAARMAKQREDVLTTVTKLYYERRRAQIDMQLNPPSDVADALRAELRIQELTADLDALTGFWFSAQVGN